jgi:hypothetical protein
MDGEFGQIWRVSSRHPSNRQKRREKRKRLASVRSGFRQALTYFQAKRDAQHRQNAGIASSVSIAMPAMETTTR